MTIGELKRLVYKLSSDWDNVEVVVDIGSGEVSLSTCFLHVSADKQKLILKK